MALVNGMAISDGTKTKHHYFHNILRTHAVISRRIIVKHRWCHPRYFYIDTNAGSGIVTYNDGTKGETSGLVACRQLHHLSFETIPLLYHAVLIDIELANCHGLAGAVPIRDSASVKILYGDNRETMPKLDLPRNTYGLLYHDPNNLIPDWDMLEALAANPLYERIDFLIYMSGANHKRDRVANGRDYLVDRLQRLKKHWIVQEPHDKHQKTFLLGANWGGLDGFKKDLRFVSVATEAGRNYLERINLTTDERFLVHQGALLA